MESGPVPPPEVTVDIKLDMMPTGGIKKDLSLGFWYSVPALQLHECQLCG